MTTVLRTSRSIREYLNEAINDTLHKNALDEEEKQEAQVSSSELFSDKGDTSKTATNDAAKSSDTTKEQPEAKLDTGNDKLKTGEITVDDIISSLNSIRSGKSFSRDEEVLNSLTSYVNNLSKAEKTALLAFLKGISQIVTGVVDADTATEPKDAPADVTTTKKNVENDKSGSTTRHVQPSVTKSSSSTSSTSMTKQTGAENTSAPKKTALPVTPKTR